MVSVAGEMGEGVVVAGESSARGMELVTRSEASGLCFVGCRGGEGIDEGVVEGRVEGGGGWGVFFAASSHAARADGSTGQVGRGASDRGVCTLLDEVFPILLSCHRHGDRSCCGQNSTEQVRNLTAESFGVDQIWATFATIATIGGLKTLQN